MSASNSAQNRDTLKRRSRSLLTQTLLSYHVELKSNESNVEVTELICNHKYVCVHGLERDKSQKEIKVRLD